MTEDRPILNVILNEDSIDLRKESFDRTTIKNRSPHRTTSHQILSQSQMSGEREPLKAHGLKKLANNLYLNQQTNVLQKGKNNFRSKQRNRATSADPRFRRERSPAYSKEASQTQSDSQVMESPFVQYDRKRNKSRSDSKFILDRQLHAKKTLIPISAGPCAADQSEPIKCKSSVGSDSKCSPRNEDCVQKGIADKASTVKYSAVSQIYSCDTLNQSNVEHSTMTEEMKTNHGTGIDGKSLYETALTDVNLGNNNIELEVYNAGICLDDKEPLMNFCRKPYWDDPRLLEKYSKLLKPVRIKKSKSSWTLPLATEMITTSTTCVLATQQPRQVCSKCICANLPKEDYAYQAYEEISESVNYDQIRKRIYNAMRNNYYLAAFFILGSLCGLMLTALIIWVLASDFIWELVKKPESPKPTGIRWWAAYVGGGVLHGINLVCSQIYRLFTLSRNEAFDPSKPEG